MEYFPIIIWIALIILLVTGAILWNSGTSFFFDPDLGQIRDILEKISSECGHSESLTVRRGKSFYTKDRKTIYLNLPSKKSNKTNKSYDLIIRKSIHELAHCLNRDASEHGAVFQQIESKLLSKAKILGFLMVDIELKEGECLTVLKEDDSEERAHRGRMNYSMFFDPKTIY